MTPKTSNLAQKKSQVSELPRGSSPSCATGASVVWVTGNWAQCVISAID